MGHIELARWAQLVLVAPATADFIARLAGGRADDLLATLCVATEAPIVIAPAMNRVMWASKATQANIGVLQSRGVRILGPGVGDQACGEVGAGRMWEPQVLASTLLEPPANAGLLAGHNILITAGPTRERLDPVRYLTNRSSGKMGFAVAAAAREAGAHVTLITGPVQLATPAGVTRINVESAREMYAAVHRHVAEADVFIAAAAVADFQPVTIAKQKIKKQGTAITLDLEPAPDIVKSVADMSKRPLVVGFAAETNDVEENARSKLKRKRLDMIAANQVGDGLACFGRAASSRFRAPRSSKWRASSSLKSPSACPRPTERRGAHRASGAARLPKNAPACAPGEPDADAAQGQGEDPRSADRAGISAAPACDRRFGRHGLARLPRRAPGARAGQRGADSHRHFDLRRGSRSRGLAAAEIRPRAQERHRARQPGGTDRFRLPGPADGVLLESR
jgi:phosphopantothenoylcysteine decarboxylase/phosphopantothenate--cysteine ligase